MTQVTAFEYLTEFIALPYRTSSRGIFFKTEEATTEPDIPTFLHSTGSQALMNKRGQEGWDLVSTEPVMRGHTQIGNQNVQGWALGFALPIGYLMFFKRPRLGD